MHSNSIAVFCQQGIAEAPPSDRVLTFSAQARTVEVQRLSLVLPGLGAFAGKEQFSHEIVVPANNPSLQEMVDRSITVRPVQTVLTSPEQPVEFEVRFEPLRPFNANLEFIVNKRSGGRWRYELRVEATEPEPDDIIVVEAMMGHTSSVAFELTNQFPTYAPFRAYFTLESPAELVVHPPEGVLPPYGSEGVSIVVSYTCTEYGKARVGKLIIEVCSKGLGCVCLCLCVGTYTLSCSPCLHQTDDMRWSYEVRGTHPEFKAPAVAARVEHRLPRRLAEQLEHHRTPPRNIMRDNMNVSRAGGPAKTRKWNRK